MNSKRRIRKLLRAATPVKSRTRGFAMPNVLALSVIVMIFAASMLNAIMPMLQKTAQLKNGHTARALAEASLDYVVGQLNNSLSTGQINATWDPGTTPGATVSHNINAAMQLGYSPTNTSLTPSITVTVMTLKNASTQLTAPSGTVAGYSNYQKTYPTGTLGNPYVPQFLYDSILYDPSATSLNYNANCLLYNGQGSSYKNPYRQLTATVVFGNVVENLRVILQPICTSYGTPRFPYAVFGLFDFELWGQAGTNTYNGPTLTNSAGQPVAGTHESRIYADLGTLGAGNEVGTGSLTRGVVEGGYHFEYPINNQADQNAINYTLSEMAGLSVVSQAPWVQIMGNVFSNGDTEGYWPRGGTTSSTTLTNSYNNVFGLPDGINPNAPSGVGGDVAVSTPTGYTTPSLSGWSGGSVTSYEAYSSPSTPSVPSAPTGTVSLGQVYLQGNQTMTISPSYTSVKIDSSGNYTMPPGNYSLTSLTMVSNGNGSPQILVDPQTNASSATTTQFYFSGSSNGTIPLSVDNSSQINMMWNGSYQITPNTGMNTSGSNGITNNGTAATPNGQLAINDPNNPSLTNNITETSGSASLLQMYYSGSSTMNLLGNERMVLYAPNAYVNVGSQPITHDANFYGALVAYVPRIISDFYSGGGAYVHYDYNLRPPMYQTNTSNGFPNLYDPASAQGAPSPMVTSIYITGFRAVTWQEAIVPNTNPALARWY